MSSNSKLENLNPNLETLNSKLETLSVNVSPELEFRISGLGFPASGHAD
jgi:hypothetical protein